MTIITNDEKMTKVCFVTGGASGIGAQCGEAFAALGYKIVLADINDGPGNALCKTLQEKYGQGCAMYAHCNVMKANEIRSAIEKTLERYARLDIAVNCAGITGGKLVPIHEMTEEEFDLVHNIDSRGIFLCVKEEIRVMREQVPIGHGVRQSRGVIVNVSSRAGMEGVPNFGAYCAAKHAVLGLTKVAALENADRWIRVNAICPGLITTPGHTSDPTHQELDAKLAANVPMRRWGEPEECTDGILFLASDKSSFMTGSALEVDGGMAAKSR